MQSCSMLGWITSPRTIHEFKDHKAGMKYGLEAVKKLLASGIEAIKTTLGLKDLKPKYIEGIFFESPQQAWNHSFEFARLASLKYEPRGRSRFPADWVPVLTLGTVVKIVRPSGQMERVPAHLPIRLFCLCAAALP